MVIELVLGHAVLGLIGLAGFTVLVWAWAVDKIEQLLRTPQDKEKD